MDWQAGKFTSAGRLGCGWPQGLIRCLLQGRRGMAVCPLQVSKSPSRLP